MKAPDDGKKYGWFVDTRRCFGCHGREVSYQPLINLTRRFLESESA
jgi:hypothetical protein